MTEESFENRLIKEKSPYLLQHAHNPVDWFPWGDEAFEKAKTEDRPIFLSIGYATCHWCHVMEKESFENQEIASLMNDTFINVKVDREEQPEVDSIYMEFAQALMSSAGGWPLNVILTPDLKPFFATTYLPAKTSKGLIGMDQFIQQIQILWKSEERSILIAQADKIVDLFKKTAKVVGEDLPSSDDLQNAIGLLFEIADPVYGGIKGEPKFPLGYQADFLLQYGKENKDSRSLFYIDLTLQMMARGGIYDHLGGGFSRYCIDEKWHIPHFEKMLYDNAILSKTYLEAYKFNKNPQFGEVAKETLDYMIREMQQEEGGFASAEDADSEGQEGKFYTWKIREVQDVLGPADSEFFCKYYGMTTEGNFEGANVLYIAFDPKDFADVLGASDEKISQMMDSCREKLLVKRNERVKPFKDDKIITSWNGLIIDVLARAGRCFDRADYLEASIKAAECIKKNLWMDGNLVRRFRDGDARFDGGLDDYAFLIRGLITLFEMDAGTHYLEWAMELSQILERDFKVETGAFYQTKESEYLLIRKCEFYDGAEPSGNAVHCENLLRLYQITQKDHFLEQAEDILRAAKPFIQSFPPGACYHLMCLQRYLDKKAPTILVALNEAQSLKEEISKALSNHFFPHGVVLWKRKSDEAFDSLLPFSAEQVPIDEKTTFYLCRDAKCEAPLTEMSQILQAIENL